MKKLLLLTTLFLVFFSGARAEGTKELMPDSTKPAKILIANGTVMGQQRDPFALYNGNAEYRLYIHIENYTQEVIYFGVGANSGNAVNWRIHKPDGSVAWLGTTPNSGNGFINNYNEAVKGPKILNPSGYTSLSVTPTMNGDYFMTFEVGNGQQRTFDYFDITVVKPTPTPVAITGRVYSKNWQIRNPQQPGPFAPYYTFDAKMFIYSLDGIVTRLDANDFEGRDFSFCSNESGCYPVGPGMPANQARKSVSGRHTYPEFKVFLNDPDNTVYPSGVLGSLVTTNTPVVQTVADCSTGTISFTFEVTATGSVEINLQLSGLGGTYTDRLITQNVSAGWNTLTWDGYDGSIPPVMVPSGSQFPFTLTYINGMTHLPLYDVENNINGFIVELVRPVGPEPNFYWDDSELFPPPTPGPVMSPPGGCVSSISPCHNWNNESGDQRSMNTWWYVANTSTSPVVIMEERQPLTPGPITGPTSVCPGATGKIYWINKEVNSTSYSWSYTGTGATITTVNDTTISVDFANNATSGNIKVNGNNVECGAGMTQSLAVTIQPAPVVSLNAFTPVCIDAPAFTLTGGNPTGGIYSIGGTPVVTFNPASYGPGNFVVTYTYTDPVTTCTANDQKTLTVNPLPLVSLAPQSAVCANIPPFPLTGGLPSGGTYSGPGVTGGNTFSPALAGPGTHTITYSFTDANFCTNTAATSLTVFPVTNAVLAPLSNVCVNVAPYPLTGGTPVGGIYSGTGVTGGIFDPAAAGPGTYTITYTYTDGNGCVTSDSKPITVLPLPGTPGVITGNASVCQGTSGLTYSTTPIANATSYTWTISPAGAGTITGSSAAITVNWSPGFSGFAQVFVTGVNGCGPGAISAPFDVTVNPKPIVTFTYCIDSVTITTAKPIILKGGIPLGGTYSGNGVNSSTGVFTPSAAGLGTHTVTYIYTNTYGCVSMAAKTILVRAPAPFACGGTLTDIRDNKTYQTVLIGLQCWMAQNLNYGTTLISTQSQRDNCIVEKYCYSDNPASCATRGGLYQWDELMAYTSAASAQGLCPPGWHVPSEAEWNQLFAVYISNGFAGNPLKYTGYSGYNAFLYGVDFFNRSWNFDSFATILWSSTSHGPGKAWAHGMNTYNPSVSYYPSYRANAFSVRCVKD